MGNRHGRHQAGYIKASGYAAAGAVVTSSLPASAATQPFDIDRSFVRFMNDIGGTPSDAGGKVTFTGQDPIIRSHFRVGAAMAMPAMGAALGAAAIWRARTGQGQDLKVDLRESIYNVNPLISGLKLMMQAQGMSPAGDDVPAISSSRPSTACSRKLPSASATPSRSFRSKPATGAIST
ncbi:hypothetical protein [Sandarakinorhabdus glacialis]|uniref:hypothetical protein n=1 Tax=Sandarakinorhabdus glacialis TaxID=1614636 RepID=UPI00166D4FC6|nr:hypothetical protein [Polymorphobacter glacialis]